MTDEQTNQSLYFPFCRIVSRVELWIVYPFPMFFISNRNQNQKCLFFIKKKNLETSDKGFTFLHSFIHSFIHSIKAHACDIIYWQSRSNKFSILAWLSVTSLSYNWQAQILSQVPSKKNFSTSIALTPYFTMSVCWLPFWRFLSYLYIIATALLHTTNLWIIPLRFMSLSLPLNMRLWISSNCGKEADWRSKETFCVLDCLRKFWCDGSCCYWGEEWKIEGGIKVTSCVLDRLCEFWWQGSCCQWEEEWKIEERYKETLRIMVWFVGF